MLMLVGVGTTAGIYGTVPLPVTGGGVVPPTAGICAEHVSTVLLPTVAPAATPIATLVPSVDGVSDVLAVSLEVQVKVVPVGNAEPGGCGVSPNVP